MEREMIADLGGDDRHPDHSLFDRVAKSFKDLIMMLLAILPLVSSKESLFKTNVAQMWVSVVSIIIYCLARLSNADVAFISGSLATVSLVSIFLQDSIGFLVFILWSLVPLAVTYQRIRSIFNNTFRLDRQMIMNFIISKFSIIWTWLTRSNSSEQEQEQPRARVSP